LMSHSLLGWSRRALCAQNSHSRWACSRPSIRSYESETRISSSRSAIERNHAHDVPNEIRTADRACEAEGGGDWGIDRKENSWRGECWSVMFWQ
jgi:hypothetical protein